MLFISHNIRINKTIPLISNKYNLIYLYTFSMWWLTSLYIMESSGVKEYVPSNKFTLPDYVSPPSHFVLTITFSNAWSPCMVQCLFSVFVWGHHCIMCKWYIYSMLYRVITICLPSTSDCGWIEETNWKWIVLQIIL